MLPDYVSVSLPDVSFLHLLAGEAALLLGNVIFQGEYVQANVRSGPGYSFNAWYGQVSFFLTGETRNYKGPNNDFGGITPKNNFGENGGIGAWELALRLSRNNLNSKDISGGQLTDITAGLNWYLNPAAKVMFNYVNAHLHDVGRANIFQMRFQVAF
jgi:phosphate-selective porin OprO/OprP